MTTTMHRARVTRLTRATRTLAAVASAAALTVLTACQGPHGGVDGLRDDPVGHRAAGQSRTDVDLARHVREYTAGFSSSGGYSPPAPAERRAIAEGVGLLLDGRRGAARERLADAGYTVRTLTDRATGRRVAEVAGRSRSAEARRGWGRVYLDLDATARWSVQVPHPVADLDTERLGTGVLRGARGGVLVLAGAHRAAGHGDAADAAHRRDTVFDAVCTELVRRGLPAVQIHGFAHDSAPRYDAIVSTGRGTDGRPDARRLADALRDRGFRVCRAWARSCPLEGRTNVQGSRAAASGVPFLHVEYAREVRKDEGRADMAAGAMAGVTPTWGRG
ncbi:hypothetical protein [Streptomyces violens]|uniref:hypothetical protein n=1 Tax=Streptomyces violens TaxID=66377 RepID=UPI001FE0D69E|nr:hypothetical protein [Streptomyces violens]